MPDGLDPSRDPLPEQTADLVARPRTLGDWHLEAVLGRGATSLVYAARHAGTGVRRALKVQRLPGPQVAARIRREGQLQARLRHPGLLPVYATFELHGRVILEMQPVSGPTLESLVGAAHPVSLERARSLLLPVLQGLDAAHRIGVVHRDLKPANVLVEAAEDRGILGDFGIAKVLGEVEDPLETRAGLPLGTPGFMPPEQWADPGAVGIRADVFAAGALVYYTLSGRPPFSGADPTALLRATLEGRCDDLAAARPDCPPALVAAVSACLDPRPEARPGGVGPLLRALAEQDAASVATDTIVPLAPTAPRAARRLPGRVGAALAGTLLGLLGWAALRALGVIGVPPAPPPTIVVTAPDEAPDEPDPTPVASTPAPAPPPASPVPGCVASEGELIGWWWAGEELRKSLWGGVRVPQETNVRAAPPTGSGGDPAPIRCVLPAGSRVDVRAEPLEIGGQLWVPLYGGDLRRR